MMNKKCYWFLFYKEELVFQRKEETYSVPYGETPPPFPVSHWLEGMELEGIPCRVASLDTFDEESEEYHVMGLRASYGIIEDKMYYAGGKAFQLVYWDRTTQFCPVCGTRTEQTGSICKKCPSCGYEQFPSISPAAIVLIRKDDSILLVRARNFRGTFKGLVAGFLEAGETLEECVAREVMEETGLSVCNITYFGNQSWPYPSTQMIGFIADYAGGEIQLQDEELSFGAFFTKDNLPELPRKLSLARKMIDWWLEQDT